MLLEILGCVDPFDKKNGRHRSQRRWLARRHNRFAK